VEEEEAISEVHQEEVEAVVEEEGIKLIIL
jgi:hypothetical protein